MKYYKNTNNETFVDPILANHTGLVEITESEFLAIANPPKTPEQLIDDMIKEQAEVFGWKANIEERIPYSLESVDVGLRKDDLRVAVEICHEQERWLPSDDIQVLFLEGMYAYRREE